MCAAYCASVHMMVYDCNTRQLSCSICHVALNLTRNSHTQCSAFVCIRLLTTRPQQAQHSLSFSGGEIFSVLHCTFLCVQVQPFFSSPSAHAHLQGILTLHPGCCAAVSLHMHFCFVLIVLPLVLCSFSSSVPELVPFGVLCSPSVVVSSQTTFLQDCIQCLSLLLCSFKGVDIALFSAGGSISKKLGPVASDAGCTVSHCQ